MPRFHYNPARKTLFLRGLAIQCNALRYVQVGCGTSLVYMPDIEAMKDVAQFLNEILEGKTIYMKHGEQDFAVSKTHRMRRKSNAA